MSWSCRTGYSARPTHALPANGHRGPSRTVTAAASRAEKSKTSAARSALCERLPCQQPRYIESAPSTPPHSWNTSCGVSRSGSALGTTTTCPGKHRSHEQAGARGLGPTRHDHEAVPVVTLGVLPCPSRFASRVVRERPRSTRPKPGAPSDTACRWPLNPWEKRSTGAYPFSARDTASASRACSPWPLRLKMPSTCRGWSVGRVDEERQSRCHEHHDDGTEAPEQSPSPTVARSSRFWIFGWNALR